MIKLNIQNVEELVFYDSYLREALIQHKNLFDQWKLAQQVPALRTLGQRSVLDFLKSINLDDINVLEGYFKNSVEIEPLEYNSIKNYKFKVSEFEDNLCRIVKNGNISLYRDKDYIYLSMWR